MRLSLLSTLVLMAALLCPAFAAAQDGGTPSDAAPRESLRKRLAALASDTKTASWVQEAWAKKGKKISQSRARCLWAGPQLIRLDVEEGDGSGSTAVLKDGLVYVRPPSLLHVLTLKFKLTDSTVRSIRDHSFAETGFVDDLQEILGQWEKVAVTLRQGEAVLEYVNSYKLPTRMTVRLEPLEVVQLDSFENGELVEHLTLREVRLNPPLDKASFDP